MTTEEKLDAVAIALTSTTDFCNDHKLTKELDQASVLMTQLERQGLKIVKAPKAAS